jgi:L-ascorbate metabolism protein UlaG (beta-lactamase superfamily)
MPVTFRWLGVAGLEFQLDGQTLLVDPMFTRPPVWQLLMLRGVKSNREIITRYVHQAQHVLVTHAHYDHLLDVAEILQITGAQAFGSPNTCDLLTARGLPAKRVKRVAVGDQFSLGPYAVEVFPARHTITPMDRWINGPLPARVAIGRRPLRLVDYRMDENFSFRIQTPGCSFLVGNHPTPADVLFIAPYHSPAVMAEVVRAVSPRLVVLIHWDNFMRPLSRPLRVMPVTRLQGLSGWPPLRRLDLRAFAQRLEQSRSGLEVLVPEIFQVHEMGE